MVTRLIQDASVGPEAFQLDEVDIAERPEVAIKYGMTATPAVARPSDKRAWRRKFIRSGASFLRVCGTVRRRGAGRKELHP